MKSFVKSRAEHSEALSLKGKEKVFKQRNGKGHTINSKTIGQHKEGF